MNEKTKNIQSFYNLIAEEYADRQYENEQIAPLLKRFLSLLPARPKVLDLGCGTGCETMRLVREGAAVTGIDFCAEPLRIARERNPEAVFRQMNFFEISTDLGMFDGILSAASFVHTDNSGIKRLLPLIKAIHKPGGPFLVIFQKGQGQRIHYPEAGGRKIERIIERHTREEMITLFSESGYRFSEELTVPDDPGEMWMALLFLLPHRQ